jgi:hypothetical protein
MAKGFGVFLGILASKNTTINVHYARFTGNGITGLSRSMLFKDGQIAEVPLGMI